MSRPGHVDKVMRRWQRAKHPAATDEGLSQLAGDEDWWVRRAVWENPSAPDEAKKRLEADNFECVTVTVETVLRGVFSPDLGVNRVHMGCGTS